MQQYLPFTVLKQDIIFYTILEKFYYVATVLTVYGIETAEGKVTEAKEELEGLQQYLPFTVLKLSVSSKRTKKRSLLQQYLPFTVLKLKISTPNLLSATVLQQYLPFTVLKLAYRNPTRLLMY